MTELGLGDKRRLFTQMTCILVQYAQMLGYTCSWDATKTCPNCPNHHKNSLHGLGLALDLNLYLDGKYLTSTDDHLPLGELWEFMGGTWGGRFNDGNHYSLPHGGMK